MRLNPGTRTRLLATVTCDIDPEGSTVEIKVDDQWYPAEWLGTATTTAQGKWVQEARTTGYFAGPDADGTAAVILTRARHTTKARVTKGTDILVCDVAPLEIK